MVKTQSVVFRVMMPCSPVGGYAMQMEVICSSEHG
jgi:hypothetical protein